MTAPKPTQEGAFEAVVEAHLLEHGGWIKGSPADFERERAVDARQFFAFVEATQPEVLTELRKQHATGLEEAVIDKLAKELDARGCLDVLRHGFKFYGKRITTAYFRPAHGLNPDVLAAYAKNRLVVTRQVRFAVGEELSIDMLLSLNGLPVATVELKNPLTGQAVEHATKQYRFDRDPRHKLLQFKRRALVHFAVDPDAVYMTTRLDGPDKTRFLPFNRGNNDGAGNPPHPSGHRTAYLWEEVWQRDSFLDIVGRFLHLEVKEEVDASGKRTPKEALVFPRYHQLEAVRLLEATARAEGVGHNYLIQHSAGSGKSNSIGWLAHRLSNLHTPADEKVFDTVVVITDRRVLDKQLQDTIYQFEHKQGVVERIDKHSSQLAEALAAGTPIVITTLQKFPFVTEKIGSLPGRRYAIIVDEAHSSQSGESARTMKEVLAAPSLEQAAAEDVGDDDDYEDRLVQVMKSRGRQKNLSFFAFTATPKAKTLETFGRRDVEGKPRPFHVYSMRQAIEERFILDVLKNYTTYKSYYRLVKATQGDPELERKRATKALARFMSLHPHNLAQKTEIIVEHFRQLVRGKIGGRAKAMVVTASRLHAVRYKLEFDRYLKDNRYRDISVLVAFSGTVKDGGLEYTEPDMNDGIPERGLPDEFAKDGSRILLVANKYQTGFDQPLLHTMYVDKRLAGVQAVQTLSRLNRTAQDKEDTFVLDFVNDVEEIRRSFLPYYEQTTVAESADPAELDRLKHELDAAQVYWQSEVEAFAKVFYKPQARQRASDNAEFYRHITPAVDRFKALDEDAQEEFRNRLGAYVRLYAFLAQIMPYTDAELEKLYTFGRFLQLKLPARDADGPLRLDEEVVLTHIHRKKTFEGDIALQPGDEFALKAPTDVGTSQAKDEQIKLSQIIELLNDRFGTEFRPEDELVFDQFVADAKADGDIRRKALANKLENFKLALREPMEGIMIDRMDRNGEIVTRYLNDKEFATVLFNLLAQRIYDELRAE